LEYLIEYGMFLAKAATIVLATLLIIGSIAAAGQRQRREPRKGRIKVTRLNDHIDEMRDTLREEVLEKGAFKLLSKKERKRLKAEQKARIKELKAHMKEEGDADEERKPRVYVLNFKGNIAADAVASLREEITAVLTMAQGSDEVLVRLESPGGMVHSYGLAASQLTRIKNQQIPLTVCVDKVAASGGYMMACLADKLVAAPFAVIGSIGVLVQLPNFNRVLRKYDVDYEMISAGEYKRTLTSFGEITKKGRDKVQEDVETIHQIFKDWVKNHRPSVDIDKVATGETWLGSQAKERYMVDDIRTSDECIVTACEAADVFEVEFELKKSLQDKLGKAFASSMEHVFQRLFKSPNEENYQ